jgi:hypothetical protein
MRYRLLSIDLSARPLTVGLSTCAIYVLASAVGCSASSNVAPSDAGNASSEADGPATSSRGTSGSNNTSSDSGASQFADSGTVDASPSSTSSSSSADGGTADALLSPDASGATDAQSDAASAAGACPTGAYFCTGFEDSGLPAGASYQPSYLAAQWNTYMTLDTAIVHTGKQSLKVLPAASTSYDWRMLAVQLPSPSFWVRMYVQSDVDLGQAEHNAYFLASIGSGDPNAGSGGVQFAEQYCQVLLNYSDQIVLSTTSDGMSACGHGGAIITKSYWHCIEAHYDGAAGDVSVYSDGAPVISKTAWASAQQAFASFSFGFVTYHGPTRTMWYDDVVVAPMRVGCL